MNIAKIEQLRIEIQRLKADLERLAEKIEAEGVNQAHRLLREQHPINETSPILRHLLKDQVTRQRQVAILELKLFYACRPREELDRLAA